MQRRFEDPYTKSMFGSIGNHLVTCEREWKNNKPNVSCVPAGFYHLVPHDGTRYKNTIALVGSTVTAEPTAAPRSACVFHWASNGIGLKGCISIAHSIVNTPNGMKLYDRNNNWVNDIRQLIANANVYLEIRNPDEKVIGLTLTE